MNEPCDIGADYSTFDFFRRGEVPPIPKDPFGLPHTTERFVRPVEGLLVVVGRRPHGRRPGARHLGGHYRDDQLPAAALHVVQLHAHRRGDARGRAVLGDGRGVGPRQRRPHRRDPRPRSSSAGVFDDTAFVLVADHGMEENDPGVPRRLGRRAARRRASRPATRPTASSTSGPEAEALAATCARVSSSRARCSSRSSLMSCVQQYAARARRSTTPTTGARSAARLLSSAELTTLVAAAAKQTLQGHRTPTAPGTAFTTPRTATATPCRPTADSETFSTAEHHDLVQQDRRAVRVHEHSGRGRAGRQRVHQRRDAVADLPERARRQHRHAVGEDHRGPRRAVPHLLGARTSATTSLGTAAVADAKVSGTYCIDKDTGAILEVSATNATGKSSTSLEVTDFSAPTAADFVPPATPTPAG